MSQEPLPPPPCPGVVFYNIQVAGTVCTALGDFSPQTLYHTPYENVNLFRNRILPSLRLYVKQLHQVSSVALLVLQLRGEFFTVVSLQTHGLPQINVLRYF